MGRECRYDKTAAKPEAQRALAVLPDDAEVIPVCPETLGGLPTPRPPANLVGGDGAAVLGGVATVVTSDGVDVTSEFVAGAESAVALAKERRATHACLKARSPSCGVGRVSLQAPKSADGRVLVDGDGVTAAALKRHGLKVFSYEDLLRER